MPNKESARKRVRQNIKARERNRAIRGEFRTALRKAEQALAAPPAADDKAAEAVAAALQVVGSTCKKGHIHRNKAARHQSNLMRKLNARAAAKA